jgi:magnesium chelatase family protein
MLARRLPGILPELSHEEALEVMALHSVAGLLSRSHAFSTQRPFRAPHHTISDVALVGGGETPRPGEVSLAHRGVLFLDELGEYKRTALEALRQPLEDGHVTVSRALAKATFRARPMVVAATNPCPCGHLGRSTVPCRCTRDRIVNYRARLSGPLLDRIDLQVVLAPVDVSSLQAEHAGESSRDIRARVVAARGLQRERAGRSEEHLNASLPPRELSRVCKLSAECREMLTRAATSLGLSARAYTKVLRVARTIADLEGSVALSPAHVAEAISYRALDRERTEARPAA